MFDQEKFVEDCRVALAEHSYDMEKILRAFEASRETAT